MKRRKSNKSYIAKLRYEVRLLRKEIAELEDKLRIEIEKELNVALGKASDTTLHLEKEFKELTNEFEKRTGFRKDRFLKRLFNKIFKRRQ